MPTSSGRLTGAEKSALIDKARAAGITNITITQASSTLEGGRKGLVSATAKGTGGYVGETFDYSTGTVTTYVSKNRSSTLANVSKNSNPEETITMSSAGNPAFALPAPRGYAYAQKGESLGAGVYRSNTTGRLVYVSEPHEPTYSNNVRVSTDRGSFMASQGFANKLSGGSDVYTYSSSVPDTNSFSGQRTVTGLTSEPSYVQGMIQTSVQPRSREFGTSSYTRPRYELFGFGFGGEVNKSYPSYVFKPQIETYLDTNVKKILPPLAMPKKGFRETYNTKPGTFTGELAGIGDVALSIGYGYNYYREEPVSRISRDVTTGYVLGEVFTGIRSMGYYNLATKAGVKEITRSGIKASIARKAGTIGEGLFIGGAVGGLALSSNKEQFLGELGARSLVASVGFYGAALEHPQAVTIPKTRFPRKANYAGEYVFNIPVSEKQLVATSERLEAYGKGYNLYQNPVITRTVSYAGKRTVTNGMEVFTGDIKNTFYYGTPKISYPNEISRFVSYTATGSMNFGSTTSRLDYRFNRYFTTREVGEGLKSGSIGEKIFIPEQIYKENVPLLNIYSRRSSFKAVSLSGENLPTTYSKGFYEFQLGNELRSNTLRIIDLRGETSNYGATPLLKTLYKGSAAKETSGGLVTETIYKTSYEAKGSVLANVPEGISKSSLVGITSVRILPISSVRGRARTVNKISPILNIKPVTNNLYKPALIDMIKPKTQQNRIYKERQGLIPIQLTKSTTSFSQKRAQIPITTIKIPSTTPQNPPPLPRPRIDLIPPPTGITFFGGAGGFGSYSRKSRGNKRKYGYSPSLVSQVFNIRGKVRVPKGGFTGLEIRPIPR